MATPRKEKRKVWDYGYQLYRLYPDLSRQEAMQKLMDQHGSIREIHRVTGIPLVCLSRWCKRTGVYNPSYPPSGYQFIALIRALGLKEGDTPRKRLKKLFEEMGTWRAVAAKLGVTEKELQRYRYKLKMVPRSEWASRSDVVMRERETTDGHREQWERYYQW